MSGASSDRRQIPDMLYWSMTFINRVGFPIAVCFYLGYLQVRALPIIVKNLEDNTRATMNMQSALENNTRILELLKQSKWNG